MSLSNRALLIIAIVLSILLVLSGMFLIIAIFPPSGQPGEIELIVTRDGPNGTIEALLTQTNIAISNYNATQTALPMTSTP